MTDATKWPETPAARALLARAKRADFRRTLFTPLFGEPFHEWTGITPEGLAIIEHLDECRRKAVTKEIGVSRGRTRQERDEDYNIWAERYLQIPSASDALEAEFHRRCPVLIDLPREIEATILETAEEYHRVEVTFNPTELLKRVLIELPGVVGVSVPVGNSLTIEVGVMTSQGDNNV